MATAFNVDDLIIDHVLSGTMFDKATGAPKFCLTMIEEPTLELGGEKVYADDPLGQHIAAFNRSKTATFSGSNSLFSLGLMADQVGAAKQVGTSSAKIQAPRREQLQVSGGKVTLKDTPVVGTISIGKMNSSKSLTGEYIKVGTSSNSGEASVSAKVITMPTSGVSDGDFVAVYYKTDIANAVKITNAADTYTSAGERFCSAISVIKLFSIMVLLSSPMRFLITTQVSVYRLIASIRSLWKQWLITALPIRSCSISLFLTAATRHNGYQRMRHLRQ